MLVDRLGSAGAWRALFAALFIAVAGLLLALAAAQPAAGADRRSWVRQYAPSAGSDTWLHAAQGPAGSVYVAGWRNGESAGQRLMVAKYTASGRRVWVRSLAGRDGQTGPSVLGLDSLAVDGRGNAFVVGNEYSSGANAWHVAVFKLANRTGRRVWVKRLVGQVRTSSDWSRGLALGPQGAVFVTGSITTTDSGNDAFLLKLVDKGSRASRAWLRTYRNASAPPLKNGDEGSCVVVDGRGRVYWGGSSDQGTGHSTMFVRRVAGSTGKTVWTRRVANDPDVSLGFVDLALFAGGGVVAAGLRVSGGTTGLDTLIVRYDANGSERMLDVIESPDSEAVRDLVVDRDRRIVVAGALTDAVTHVQSGWIRRCDSMGRNVWSATFDSPQAGDPASFARVVAGPSGSFYCGGRSTTGFISGVDLTVVRYSAAGAFVWAAVFDDRDANRMDECRALLYVGGSRPGVYAAGYGGATTLGEAVLVKYRR